MLEKRDEAVRFLLGKAFAASKAAIVLWTGLGSLIKKFRLINSLPGYSALPAVHS